MRKTTLALMLLIAINSAMGLDTMLSKARSITLPTLQYREVTVREILADIQKRGVELDPEGIGINFVIKLDDALLERKLTMTVHTPTLERALSLLAATAALYIQYDPGAIVVQKSERTTDQPEK